MHVVLFHPAVMPVRYYGGTERVVPWLARGLVEMGHRVTLIAAAGTRVPHVELVEVPLRSANSHDFELAPFIPGDADLVHYFVPVHRPPDLPYLWTMQGNARPGFDPGEHCVFVSRDHARRHGSSSFVYNGIALDEYSYRESKQEYLLFLGRLHRSKGWKTAVSVAREAGREIVVAGGWRPTLRRGVRFVGQVGGLQKAELIANARAMLMPVAWDEPFGIVIAEALASGTPVIGCPRGSLPELISDDVGGLAEDHRRLAGMASQPAWAPQACRDRARSKFSHLAMSEKYVEIYRRRMDTGNIA